MHTFPDAEVRIDMYSLVYSGFLAICIYFTLLALILLPLARSELPVESRRREGEAPHAICPTGPR